MSRSNNGSFYIESHGCSASTADAEMISGLLKANSFTPVEKPESADVNILVTCIVKTATSHKMIRRIKELTVLGRPLIVAGCMPKAERQLIEAVNPAASLLGPDDLSRTVEAVTDALHGIRRTHLDGSGEPKLLLPRVRTNPVIGIVEVSSGCLGNCAYCEVKLVKGGLTSYRPETIGLEVKQALQDGCREIWLTSQDNGCYGLDIGQNLPSLLREVLAVEGDFMVRLGMMNPQHTAPLLDDLIKLYRDDDRLFKFIHIPVQSGSDRVLRDMKRDYSVADFTGIVERFRAAFPQSSLSTDIIVGYPTETEEDFQQTLKLVREVKPDTVNISRFGARPGTESERLEPLDAHLIKARSRLLHRVARDVALQNNRRWVGWRGKVLVDEVVRGAVVGRNPAYRPVVIREEIPVGRVLEVQVVDATAVCLVGETSC
ncbi:MAG: tRNA (N(6)-L-threonylcarbamoyladenosine(37)-C(2))-methylthiotransferase [Thaumarchaeota archaeon]|nr:tRNA (N(6)-L-threonylcarbamoyladenosine(37)-C(2))-methylthiotransferase [Nitrososphaerota archaeon]MCL5319055.1 tRNA (N(6)-L-threonylcarbamoyladenosine(37)-C(2))-methylthiotransferase [Nitrososphaerota archaeon]